MSEKTHKFLNRGGFFGVITAIITIIGAANGWIGNSAVQAKNVDELLEFKKEQKIVNSSVFKDVSLIQGDMKEMKTNIEWLVRQAK